MVFIALIRFLAEVWSLSLKFWQNSGRQALSTAYIRPAYIKRLVFESLAAVICSFLFLLKRDQFLSPVSRCEMYVKYCLC